MVKTFCPPNGVVADCFSGSGTTLAAAVAHGRRGIGCDLRVEMVQLAKQRIAHVLEN
jgi:DNA modification methylase